MRRNISAFEKCVEDVTARGSAYDPRAVCATAGRRKYGQAEMTRRAIAGRRAARARGNEAPFDDLDRTRLRLKQDFLSMLAEDMAGYPPSFRIAEHPGSPTLADIRRYVYPEWEHSIDSQIGSLAESNYPVVGVPDFEAMAESSIAGRGNPYGAAADLVEAWSGRPAESVEYVETPLREHSVLSKLAQLVQIRLKDARHTKIDFDAGTRLSSNEAGTHLFIEGGNQSIDLSQFPELDPTKEAVTLGRAWKITYWTAKFHLDERDKTPGPYTHTFGDESGSLPSLNYDTVNRLLSLVGGEYHIDLDMPGGYSAGIRD